MDRPARLGDASSREQGRTLGHASRGGLVAPRCLTCPGFRQSQRWGAAGALHRSPRERRVADREGAVATPETALTHAQAVLGTMAEFVSAGEVDDLRSQLPAGYAPLFRQPR
ncbi:DUF2267 domain-containing protein [Actinopolyspora erythraea]|uniref:DUF2267 domain-containing protein n=1 Tax=Actinopolyspora erythraea TaxID=414996 RepID=A0A223RWC6_9ACTN|nr:DUF2267 domain-containing protein [Actinopolyspora erythraea]